MAQELSKRAKDVLKALGPNLDSATKINGAELAKRLGYVDRGGASFYISQLHASGVIVRIGLGVYVRPGDPRIPPAGDMKQPVPRRDLPVRRTIPPPRMVAGLTLERLMAGR